MEQDQLSDDEVNRDTILIRNLAKYISNLTGANQGGQMVNNNPTDAAVVPAPIPLPTQTTKNAVKRPKKVKAKHMDTTVDSTTPTKLGKKRRIPTRIMVLNAIRTLNEPGGSALRKIKKFVHSNYDVDPRRINIFIRQYLKKAYISGELIQKKKKAFSINRKFLIPSE